MVSEQVERERNAERLLQDQNIKKDTNSKPNNSPLENIDRKQTVDNNTLKIILAQLIKK